jgi:hypothetical protein
VAASGEHDEACSPGLHLLERLPMDGEFESISATTWIWGRASRE